MASWIDDQNTVSHNVHTDTLQSSSFLGLTALGVAHGNLKKVGVRKFWHE